MIRVVKEKAKEMYGKSNFTTGARHAAIPIMRLWSMNFDVWLLGIGES